MSKPEDDEPMPTGSLYEMICWAFDTPIDEGRRFESRNDEITDGTH